MVGRGPQSTTEWVNNNVNAQVWQKSCTLTSWYRSPHPISHTGSRCCGDSWRDSVSSETGVGHCPCECCGCWYPRRSISNRQRRATVHSCECTLSCDTTNTIQNTKTYVDIGGHYHSTDRYDCYHHQYRSSHCLHLLVHVHRCTDKQLLFHSHIVQQYYQSTQWTHL